MNCSLPLDDFLAALKQFAEAGVDLFQLRDKDADGAKLVPTREPLLRVSRVPARESLSTIALMLR